MFIIYIDFFRRDLRFILETEQFVITIENRSFVAVCDSCSESAYSKVGDQVNDVFTDGLVDCLGRRLFYSVL